MSARVVMLWCHVRRVRIQIVRGGNVTDRGAGSERPPECIRCTYADIAVRPDVVSSPEKAKVSFHPIHTNGRHSGEDNPSPDNR